MFVTQKIMFSPGKASLKVSRCISTHFTQLLCWSGKGGHYTQSSVDLAHSGLTKKPNFVDNLRDTDKKTVKAMSRWQMQYRTSSNVVPLALSSLWWLWIKTSLRSVELLQEAEVQRTGPHIIIYRLNKIIHPFSSLFCSKCNIFYTFYSQLLFSVNKHNTYDFFMRHVSDVFISLKVSYNWKVWAIIIILKCCFSSLSLGFILYE